MRREPYCRPLRDSRAVKQVYPWEQKPSAPRRIYQPVTIGIGVLCSTQPKPCSPRPDALLMISDTMGSTETDSTDDLHKMYIDQEHGIYAVCADRVEMGAEVLPLIASEIEAVSGTKSHGAIWRAINSAVHKHREEHFHLDVRVPQYLNPVTPESYAEMRQEWKEYSTGAQALIGTFDSDGRALLYFVGMYSGKPGLVHAVAFPGYQAIGSGADNAYFWLNRRRQKLGLNIQQSALHIFESAMMAGYAPTVNKFVEMLYATNRDAFHLNAEQPSPSGCPVSLPGLSALAEQYGPRNTS